MELGRATLSKIKQNLFWALSYNCVSIPLAAGVLLPTYGALHPHPSPMMCPSYSHHPVQLIERRSDGLEDQGAEEALRGQEKIVWSDFGGRLHASSSPFNAAISDSGHLFCGYHAMERVNGLLTLRCVTGRVCCGGARRCGVDAVRGGRHDGGELHRCRVQLPAAQAAPPHPPVRCRPVTPCGLCALCRRGCVP